MINFYSRASLFICCAFILVSGFFYYPKWKQAQTEATISWDVSGYYWYLPAFFIYKDVRKVRFSDSIVEKYRPTPIFNQAYLHSSGNYIFKYPMGQAVLFAPFFSTGHLYAVAGPYQADGFSLPYQIFIGVGMLLYSVIALSLLRKTLLRYFSDRPTAVTLLIIVFATNYFNYSAIDGAMAHNTLFFLYSFLLYVTDSHYRKPALLKAMVIGLTIGLLTLTRPTEIVSLLIPLLWRPFQLVFRRNMLCYLFIAAAFCSFILLGQVVYWKFVSGEFVVYTYQNEGFDWLSPHILQGLFSYKGGWLVYTPVMWFAIFGFIALYKKDRDLFRFSFTFFVVFLYVCVSWREWWYGAGVGNRAMIQSYAVLAFPLSAFLEKLTIRNWKGLVAAVIISFSAAYNLWLTHQAHKGGLLAGGEMNKAYFWSIFGRFNIKPSTRSLLDNKDRLPGNIAKPVDIASKHFEQDTIGNGEFCEEMSISAPPNSSWLRVIFTVTTPLKEWETWRMPQAVVKFYQDSLIVKMNFVRVSRIMNDGETADIIVDAKMPAVYGRIGAFLWNPASDKPIIIHRIQMLVY